MRTIDDLDVAGLRVLVRTDLNVPLDGTRITDDGRIRASLPTLRALLARGARVVVCAHLGRPGGKPDPRYSLAPVAERLGELLGSQVTLAADTVGPAARAAVAALPPGGVVMLENLRFCDGETSKNDAERGAFADQLAALADAYVGDGFGVLHRRHASVCDIVQRLPHAAGYLVAAETAALGRLAADIQRPYAVVLGGAKVADKIGAVGTLLDRADVILVGGAMAFTFLAAQGHPVGSSLVEPDQLDAVRGYLDRAQRGGAPIVLPPDIVAAPARADDAPRKVVSAGQIPPGWLGLDIGPAAARLFAARLAGAKTIFWNGPMGLFEKAPFSKGTFGVARAMADASAFTVVGGGDSAAAVHAAGGDVAAKM
ncbi:MAG: phosphoglycerate kinase, partial [Actinomycetota bacterium]|nr:phosphoglycerate kinase [Actinomycetota bacterium]